MKFLITGKDGQASLAFADLLHERKEKYVTFGGKELDILDLKAVREAVLTHKPEAVFNGAADNDVDKAETDWEQAFLVNGIGPRNLAIVREQEKAWGLCHITNTGFCSHYEWARVVLHLDGWKGNLEPAKKNEFKTAANRPTMSRITSLSLSNKMSLQSWEQATDKFLVEIQGLNSWREFK